MSIESFDYWILPNMVGERLGRFAARMKDGFEDVVELVGE